MTIKRRDPVREAFASCSTGNVETGNAGYYVFKADANYAMRAALARFGYCFDENDCQSWHGNEGRVTIDVCVDGDEQGDVVGCAVISWYRMPSGRYEFTCYLS